MKINVYAVLKDYFEKEFEVKQTVNSISDLYNFLLQKNPEAKNILPACRFAVDDNFVDNNFQLKQHDNIHIIPPSSGG